ncbi:serine hydrolase domain-containing protein [Paenibacillus sp. Leaf72]|uniref:serine hydrolase domain-containing protein n=1 Tax=Paenibacillus sp. Leaf72 TaxID=1736234 RepID=UPI0012DE0B4F|nr:serine hydrolase domain-containing protein [Paenibacillus sp. Leaf72]
MESGNKQLIWTGAAGDMNQNNQFFIASTTKLFVTATILKLRELKKIQLTDQISRYLDKEILSGIHRYQGTEYSYDITIRQLMAHTSGLPDYFEQVRQNSKSLKVELLAGYDTSWSFDKVMEDVKQMNSHFPPGKKGKALYSDTNYQLLGKIIENVMNSKLEDVFKLFIYEPLALSETYIYTNNHDQTPKPLYYKKSSLHVPEAMASFGPDGGIVSTADELMRFLRAFFEGELFPKHDLSELYVWNKIFFRYSTALESRNSSFLGFSRRCDPFQS